MLHTTSRLSAIVTLLLLAAADACGQSRTAPDLPAMLSEARVHNRAAAVREEGAARFVHLDAREGDGILWVPSSEFHEGSIDVRLRGRDTPGRSFVGIAFNGVNDSTYEAVYVRPFNFQAEDATRRARSLQYVAMPAYPWQVLRNESPGEFESAIEPTPDPDDWLELRLHVDATSIRVYVGEGDAPDLVVRRLMSSQPGRVGLWVGNGSEGDFASLSVEHAETSGSVEIEDVEFRSSGTRLSGSIFFPRDSALHAAVVFVPGSGTMPRNLSLGRRFADRGIAALVYDKRGVGKSGGTYAADMSISGPNMDLLADDALAAIETLRNHERLRGMPVGFAGFSQAGWIIPLAAKRTSAAEFLALWSGCVCKMSEEDLFSIYTSDRDLPNLIAFDSMRTLRDEPYVWSERLGRDTDAVESLARLDVPGLWVFGTNDGSIPVDLSIRNLTQLVREHGARYDYVLYGGSGHATVDRGFGAVVEWIKSTVNAQESMRRRTAGSTSTPKAAERTIPDLDALTGTYVYPDPPITVSVARMDSALTAEVKGSILTLEHLDGTSFVGHDLGSGYVFVTFEPGAGRLIATEHGRSYTFDRKSDF